ncbi:MAG: hypothetical protein HZC19_03875, partial [Candidatus Omnitrophica bacterium]|nr:hypothetical protein [Candidatus Omnitrophota bacterium]
MNEEVKKFAEVAIALPIDRLFHYKIPDEVSNEIAIGRRVFVPFQTRTVVGYVVDFSESSDVKDIKDILSLIDKE